MKQKLLFLLTALLIQIGAWADDLNVDDTFEANGVKYKVTSTEPREVQIGYGLNGNAYYQGSARAIDGNTEGNFEIPSSVEGSDGQTYAVTSIAYGAFNLCKLTSVVMPNSVTSIANYAFEKCSNLESVVFSNSLKTIGMNSFSGCSNLSNLFLPPSLESIGGFAFSNCLSLKSLIIPKSVTTIDYMYPPFVNCSNLEEITVESDNPVFDSREGCNAIIETASNKILQACKNTVFPSSVTAINRRAFQGTTITSIVIPKTINQIGIIPFIDCDNLTSIKVESGNEVFDSREDCNAIIKTATNELIVACQTTFIPASITKIGNYAFDFLPITDINIPTSVIEIGNGAFESCHLLTNINIPSSVEIIGSYAFEYCRGLASLDIPSSVRRIGQGAFSGCNAVSVVKSHITEPFTINSNTFQSYYTQVPLRVPKGTREKYLATNGWKDFKSIEEVDDFSALHVGDVFVADDLYYTITNADPLEVQLGGIKSTGDVVAVNFEAANTLTKVVIPERVTGPDNKTYAVTSLSNRAFYYCTALTEVHSKLKKPTPINGNSVFHGIYNTATLYIPAGSKSYYTANTYGWGRFSNIVVEDDNLDKSLAEGETFMVDGITYQVVAPFEVEIGTGISYRSAVDNTTTGTITIPETVTYNDVTYSVTAIGNYAFYGRNQITSINIPNTIAKIGSWACSGCTALTTVMIPNSIRSIGAGAFANCENISSIIIPEYVWSIDNGSFRGCKNLSSIKVESGNTVYDSRDNCNAIVNTSSNLIIQGCKNTVIPNTIKTIGNNAFYNHEGLTSITIPNSVTNIYSDAFWGTGLSAIVIPKTVTNITRAAFSNCKSLSRIVVEEGNTVYDSRENCNAIIKTETNELIQGCNETAIPQGVVSIAYGSFWGFENLNLLDIPNSVTAISEYAFTQSGLTAISIPNSVKTIERSTFSSCISLTNVTIPESVSAIGNYAFSGCTGLEEVHSEISEPFSIGSNVFSSETYAKTLYVPYGTKALYEDTNGWKDFKNIIEEGDASDNVTLTAKSYSRVYGETNPTFEYTVTNGTITSGTPTITCSATATSPVGTYDIVIAKGTVSNGTVNLVKGTLTITKAPLTISAGDYNKVEGEDDPSFKAIYSGFKNGETETVLTKKPTITTTATKTSPAGEYPVTVSGAEAQNYEITYQNGTLTITNPVEVEVTDVSNINNVIYIEPIEETKGSEVVVPILMKNAADIRGFQFDLYLPNGVTVAKTSKGKFVCSLSSGRLPEDDEHTLTVSEQGDGALRFLCGSQYNETFTGTEGEIATMKLLISEDMAEGNYPIVLKKVKLSETDISNYYYTETVQTSLTVVSYVSGDISGDGEIDVSDYIGVANFIMGDKPEGFIEAAADVNKDKVVDVSDYIGVANIILYDNIYGPVANASRSIARMENTSSASDNLIYIEPFKADANSQATVSFKMKNTADIRGFQFDLYLPEGISMVKNGKNLLSDSRKPVGDQHALTLSEQQDGAIRFLCGSMDDETFTGNDGEIATLTVSIAGDMAQGDYPILLKKMKLSETNISNCYETESRMATITINNNSATGIEQLTTGSGSETYYNLQGQRVNTPTKGVFVKNGKKVMIK